jgi:hypothetical protein
MSTRAAYLHGVMVSIDKLIDAGVITAPGLLNALAVIKPEAPSMPRLQAAVSNYGGVLSFCEAFNVSVDSLFLWPAGTHAKRINAAIFASEANQ